MESTNNITQTIIDTINTIFETLFASIDNNLYSVLDEITFINSDILNDSNFDFDQDLDYTLEYHGIIPATSFIDIYEYQ